jgi:hypothetical protein
MKNRALFFSLLMALSAQSLALARGGGDAFAGALGGSLVGGVLGNAMASSGRQSSSEQAAEQLRIEQERHRVNQLEREMDRRDLERRIESQAKHGGNTLFMVLVAIVIVLLFGVMALGILILRKKP